MFSLDHFHRNYDTVETPVTDQPAADIPVYPQFPDRFIDPADTMREIPRAWAKTWEASILLVCFIFLGLPANLQKTMLEIGSGLGLLALPLPKQKPVITMSERDPDVLNLHGPMPWPTGSRRWPSNDWTWKRPTPKRLRLYRGIVEICPTTEAAIDCLEALFDRYLNPAGTIILCQYFIRLCPSWSTDPDSASASGPTCRCRGISHRESHAPAYRRRRYRWHRWFQSRRIASIRAAVISGKASDWASGSPPVISTSRQP